MARRSKIEIPCKGGDEFDILSHWRNLFNWKRGETRKVKRAYNRRVRREAKKELMYA